MAQLFEAALALGLSALLAYLLAPYLVRAMGEPHQALIGLQLGEFGRALLRASYTSYALGEPLRLRVPLDGGLSVLCQGQALELASGGSRLRLTTELDFGYCSLELQAGDCLLISTYPGGVRLGRC